MPTPTTPNIEAFPNAVLGPRMRFNARLLVIIAVAATYVAAAKFGLTMAFTAAQVTVVWPPAGLALAALLIGGEGLWPAILLGAFVANVTTHESAWVAIAIACGNTAEAVVGARLLTRYARFGEPLRRLRQALGLVVLAAGVSTLVSATIGTTSLCVGGIQPWTAFRTLWGTWWLGDATGDLLIAPVLLTWRAWPSHWPVARVVEAACLVTGLGVISGGVFAGGAGGHNALEYLVFPALMWAAIRFGVAGASVANVLTSGIAVWGTVHGFGPYAGGGVAEHLTLLQVFMAVAGGTTLLLGAAVSEQQAALRCRHAEHAVSRVLAEAATADDATRRILDVILTSFHWDLGLRWVVDADAERLRCAEIRHRAGDACPAFERVRREGTYYPGEPLPGHVWAYAAPQWIADVRDARQFPQLQAAAVPGVRGAFAFPIAVGRDVLGVFEFLSRTVRPPDEDLLWTLSAIGAQVGQFLVRKRAEQALAFRATHDGLTQSLNRLAFLERLEEASRRARESGHPIAVLFLDLDHFKAVNDRQGHLVGDQLLIETARRLRGSVRPGDPVARLGGDEFAVLLERITGEPDATAVAMRIIAALEQPFDVYSHPLTLRASVGIAVSTVPHAGAQDLLREADDAMYRVKGRRASS